MRKTNKYPKIHLELYYHTNRFIYFQSLTSYSGRKMRSYDLSGKAFYGISISHHPSSRWWVGSIFISKFVFLFGEKTYLPVYAINVAAWICFFLCLLILDECICKFAFVYKLTDFVRVYVITFSLVWCNIVLGGPLLQLDNNICNEMKLETYFFDNFLLLGATFPYCAFLVVSRFHTFHIHLKNIHYMKDHSFSIL